MCARPQHHTNHGGAVRPPVLKYSYLRNRRSDWTTAGTYLELTTARIWRYPIRQCKTIRFFKLIRPGAAAPIPPGATHLPSTPPQAKLRSREVEARKRRELEVEEAIMDENHTEWYYTSYWKHQRRRREGVDDEAFLLLQIKNLLQSTNE